MVSNLTYDDFLGKYHAVPNIIVPDEYSSFDNTMFETYGPELDYVAEVAKRTPKRVWTLLEIEDKLLIANGMHHVNRLGYFVTEEDASDEQECYTAD